MLIFIWSKDHSFPDRANLSLCQIQYHSREQFENGARLFSWSCTNVHVLFTVECVYIWAHTLAQRHDFPLVCELSGKWHRHMRQNADGQHLRVTKADGDKESKVWQSDKDMWDLSIFVRRCFSFVFTMLFFLCQTWRLLLRSNNNGVTYRNAVQRLCMSTFQNMNNTEKVTSLTIVSNKMQL